MTPQRPFLTGCDGALCLRRPPQSHADAFGDQCAEWGALVEGGEVRGIVLYFSEDDKLDSLLASFSNVRVEKPEIKVYLRTYGLVPIHAMPMLPVYRGLYANMDVFQLSGYNFESDDED